MKAIVFILSLLVAQFVFATGQIPDYLIVQNDTLPIFSNPLESYFELTGKRELPDFSGCGSTACWRGYKAYWKLQNDSLFLLKITSCHTSCGIKLQDANLKKMFGTNRVFAGWFTGEIVAPIGNLVQYIHMGYASIYDKEKIFTFKNGKLIKTKTLTNRDIVDKIHYRKKEKEIAKQVQDTIFYYVKNNIDWEKREKNLSLMCDEEYILTFNKKGKIKKLKFKFEAENFREKLENWWWNNITDRKCRRLIKRSLKDLDLSYLPLPGKKFKVKFEIFYNSEKKELELLKEPWMEDK